MERHFSAASMSAVTISPSSSAILTPMPAHTHVILHFSVSNTSSCLDFFSHDTRFADTMAPSFCSSSVTSSSSQNTNLSEVDLPRPPRSLSVLKPPAGPQFSQCTPSPASPNLMPVTTSEGSRPSTLRLRILHPQRKPSEVCESTTSSPVLQNTTNNQLGEPTNSTTQTPDFNLVLGWRGLKKARSKGRRARTQEAESNRSQDRRQSAIKKISSWCSTSNDNVQNGSSRISTNVESSCITEVSASTGCSNSKSDPASVDTVSWNGQSSASKLDQLALVACELKAKRMRSPRNQIRRHYYTAASFPPLSLISAYWQQNVGRTSCYQEVATAPQNDVLSLAKERVDVPTMMRSMKAVSSTICNKDRRAESFINCKIKKAKSSGRQTRVQRCARQLLELVGKDIVREKLIRQALGNNPDTSKALRLLLDQRKLGRIGGGGRKDPYKYKVTSYGLLELSEKKDASSLVQVGSTTFSGEDFVVNTWNTMQLDN